MHRRPAFLVAFPGILAVALVAIFISSACADELDDANKLFLKGKYDECLRSCEKADADDYRQEWRILHANTLVIKGRYPDAEKVVSNALVRFPNSIRLRMVGIETANSSGETNRAQVRLKEISELVNARRSWAYSDPADIVALGRAALLLGVDPKAVLERFFAMAQKADPNLREVYLASGDLALDKHDFALAAKKFEEAVKKFPDDADALCGLAHAYAPSAQGKMVDLLEKALEKNENHVPSMLLLADHLVDAEEYDEAEKLLTGALKVNPWHPEAWAYRAVLAHLRNDSAAEKESREKGLKFWNTNPQVDHLIGLKLSQKYRFAEGSGYQKRALEFDSNFLPARIQLAEDLLRLGEESEGWQLAEEVHQRDAYDVTAYNLVTLRRSMQKFATITNEDFILRMGPHEAALYGERAMALLQRGKAQLSEKYGIKLEQPTIVEIFPDQKDFAVRTFGMPGNPGYLGVCFGRVVTANSPASGVGDSSNWEAVLWHEFCHVITLQLTKNKMPRWLSEGISVYEERQANPAWGEKMNPRYREMVLNEEDLTPVSELSAAFLSPKSPQHLQFAYYESSQVVEFLVEKFGFEKLKALLRDLATGTEINDAIPKHMAAMEQLEKDFAAYAKAKAEAFGPGLNWTKAKTGRISSFEDLVDSAKAKAEDKPGAPNYWKLLEEARKLVVDKKWEEAKAPLKKLIELCPDQTGGNNAYALLAAAHRGLNETNDERAVLDRWAAKDGDAVEAFLRLSELAEGAKDWKETAQNAERFLAVNPLVPQPYRFLGRAREELGETKPAIGAYEKLLLLDPADPAEIHFRLATLLYKDKDAGAKRHVLQALEEAPRYREAHQLLLELAGANTNSPSARPPAKSLQ